MASLARVVIGDRQPLVLESLRASLLDVWPNIEIILCSELDQVLNALSDESKRIDIVFFDVTMLDTRDIQTLTNVLAAIRAVPMVVMSGQSGAETVKAALASGAASFLEKSLEPEPIFDGKLNGAAAPNVSDAPAIRTENSEEANRFASLSERQKHILSLILEGKLNKQIAGEVGIAEQTVKIHVSNILRKLGVRTRTQAAVAAQKYLSGEGSEG